MNLSRRSFLKASGLVAAAGLLPLPALAFAPGPPTAELSGPGLDDHLGLWGDGVHDDTEWLQALIDEAAPGAVLLPPGEYLLKRPLLIRGPLSWSNASIHSSGSAILERPTVTPTVTAMRS